MNYIDLFLVVLIAVYTYVGVRRGFLISLVGMLRFVVAVPLSAFVGNTYTEPIYKNYVRSYVLKYVSEKLSSSAQITDFTDGLKSLSNAFSFVFKDKSALASINAITPDTASAYITDNILCPIVQEIIKILLIVLTFLLFYVITGIIMSLAKKIRQKKNLPLHKTNSFFGGVFGLVKSLALVLVLASVYDFIMPLVTADNSFVTQLKSSVIINYINQINPLI